MECLTLGPVESTAWPHHNYPCNPKSTGPLDKGGRYWNGNKWLALDWGINTEERGRVRCAVMADHPTHPTPHLLNLPSNGVIIPGHPGLIVVMSEGITGI